MEIKPAHNCVKRRIFLTAMLKPLSLVGWEKPPRTGKSWLRFTNTAVTEKGRVTEETRRQPKRKKSWTPAGKVHTVSAAVENDHFYIIVDCTGSC